MTKERPWYVRSLEYLGDLLLCGLAALALPAINDAGESIFPGVRLPEGPALLAMSPQERREHCDAISVGLSSGQELFEQCNHCEHALICVPREIE